MLLDDEISFDLSKDRKEQEDVLNEQIDSDIDLNNIEKTTFDLEDISNLDSLNCQHESAKEVISSIMYEDDLNDEEKRSDIKLDNQSPLETSNLNTFENSQINKEVMKIESREREERLRNISMKLRTPSGLTSLEDVPAYKRNNIEISETPHSSESEISTFSLTNEDSTNAELRKNNSFLHDNVD